MIVVPSFHKKLIMATKQKEQAIAGSYLSPTEKEQINALPREKENAMRQNDTMAPSDPDESEKQGKHPFNSELKGGKLTIKHKITTDDFFLNPELRNLGFKEGEIIEMRLSDNKSKAVKNE